VKKESNPNDFAKDKNESNLNDFAKDKNESIPNNIVLLIKQL
jgi:hypothetical protein